MALTLEEKDEFIKLVKTEIQTAVKGKFENIDTKLASIQKTVDLQLNNTDTDRGMFTEMVGSQAKVEKVVKELLEIVTHQTTRIVDRVTEKAQEVVDNVSQSAGEAVEPAMDRVMRKIKNGTPLNGKRHWWQFWKPRKPVIQLDMQKQGVKK